MEKISVVVITKNEEKDIAKCLDSFRDFDEIVIVDSGSTDRTLDIARNYTDKIFYNRFEDFSSQKNFAISKCNNNWILSMDGDEVLSDKLKEKVCRGIKYDKSAYRIRRETYIFGRLMRYGGHGNDMPVRLFDKRKGRFVQPIHEYWEASGDLGLLSEPILHYSSRNIDEYMRKLSLYTDLEAEFMKQNNVSLSYAGMALRPIIQLIRKYFFMSGFRDGIEGFCFYALSAYYDYIKCFKYLELLKKI